MSASLTQAIEAAIGRVFSELRVSMPGRIIMYEHDTRKARVQPLLKRTYRDGTDQEMPIISAVPVVRVMGAGGQAGVSVPVFPGDGCLLLFADRSLDEWLGAGGSVKPDDRRKHDLSDAIAIVGLESFSTTGVEDDNVSVKLRNFISKVSLSPTGQLAIGSDIGELMSLISDFLGEASDMAASASVHIHPTGVGPSGPPTNAAEFVALQIQLMAIQTIIDLMTGEL